MGKMQKSVCRERGLPNRSFLRLLHVLRLALIDIVISRTDNFSKKRYCRPIHRSATFQTAITKKLPNEKAASREMGNSLIGVVFSD